MILCPLVIMSPGHRQKHIKSLQLVQGGPHKMALAKLELNCSGSQVELFFLVAGVEASE